MCFESNLSSEGPGALDARIVGECAEERMVGGGEVLKDGEPGADAVGADVGEGGRASFLYLKTRLLMNSE